jgi:hypothetical protein
MKRKAGANTEKDVAASSRPRIIYISSESEEDYVEDFVEVGVQE